MRNLKLVTVVGGIVVVLVAVVLAFMVGEKSELYLSGKVTVEPSLLAKAKNISTIYLILRDAESKIPMPYGAYRDRVNFNHSNSYRFVITKEKLQLMQQQASIPRVFNLKVRLDSDGYGGVDQQGDLVGEQSNVAFGTTTVELIVDREVTPPPQN